MLSQSDLKQVENIAKLWWAKNEHKKIPCAIYARRSSEDKTETSIPDQISACRRYVEGVHSLEVVSEYSEDDRSGMFSDNRDQFQRLMEDVETGKVKVVVVYSLDRLARRMSDGLMTREKILAKGGLVLSSKETFERDASGELTRRLFMAFYQYLPESTAENVMRHCMEQAEKGLNAGGQPPYGYRTIEGTGEFIINEDESPAVEYMFQAVLEGKSYSIISRDLEAMGYLTRETKSRKPKPFPKTTILGILTNPKYKGLYIYNRFGAKKKKRRVLVKEYDEVQTNSIPPIVSEEDWEEVQKILATRTNLDRSNGHGEYALTGLLFCECGNTMHGSASIGGRNKARYRRYVCSSKRKKGLCEAKPINADYLELAVANVLAPILNDLLKKSVVRKLIVEKIHDNTATLLMVNRKQLSRLEKRYKDALVGLGRLDGGEEAELAKIEIAGMRTLIEKRKAQICDLEAKSNNVKSIKSKLNKGITITAKELIANGGIFRALANQLIERIVVSKQNIEIQFRDISK